jgi:hypothetical protein
MKRRVFLLSAAIWMFCIAGCETAHQNRDSFSSEAGIFPEISNVGVAELIDLGLRKASDTNPLNEVTRFLATDKKWLRKTRLTDVKNNGVRIGDLVDEAGTSLIRIDQVDFTITIELFNQFRANELDRPNRDFSYAVALDPDRFYPNHSEIPVHFWNNNAKTVEEKVIRIEVPSDDDNSRLRMKDREDALEFPVFFVSIQPARDNDDVEYRARLINKLSAYEKKIQANLAPCEDCGGGGSAPPVKPYFVIKQINLFDKKDNSNDEFEVYIGESIENAARIYRTTIHKFNGNTRNDAAGRSVYYRDVNGDQGWEIMSNDIAIEPLVWIETDAWMRMVAVEDDDEAGVHDEETGGVRSWSIEHYSVFDDAVDTKTWDMETDCDCWWPDNDDVYGQSGITHINENSVSELLGTDYLTKYIKLENRRIDDLDIWVGIRRY